MPIKIGQSGRVSGVVRGPNDDPNQTDEELVAARTTWFEHDTTQRNVFASTAEGPFTCPCCGHLALPERGVYEICGECGWEDDGQDDHDCDVVRGGPNGRLSLDAARAMYIARGGRPEPHVPPSSPQ